MVNEDNKFVILGGVNVVAATPSDVSNINVPKNIARGHPRLHQMPEFHKMKGDTPIALIGGGPSVEETIADARGFKHTMACGSSHDYIVKSGIVPEYCAICDPDPIMANYLRSPQRETKYLVSTHADKSVFDALEGMPIALWHCGPIDEKLLNEIDPGWHAVGGGCTVGLRGLSIAIMLGYSNIHFFGFDSCLGFEDKHHAYDFTDESESLGDIHSIRIGFGLNGPSEGGKLFRAAGYQLAQAVHFKEFVAGYGNMFTPTFHGEGLLPEIWKTIKSEAEKIKQEAA